jgi:hypothetical protein
MREVKSGLELSAFHATITADGISSQLRVIQSHLDLCIPITADCGDQDSIA